MPPPLPSNQLIRNPGSITAVAGRLVFVLGVAYGITTLLGLISLTTADQPIGDPYFTIMELITMVIAPCMTVAMAGLPDLAVPSRKIFGRLAFGLTLVTTGITCCVHLVILVLRHSGRLTEMPEATLPFSFNWPSVAYVLDILAWDGFLGLALIFAALVFRAQGQQRMIRLLLIFSGILSLAGLAGIPLDNMQVRNIGIIGYALLAPIAFLLMSALYKKEENPG